jgi:hypothetical protein
MYLNLKPKNSELMREDFATDIESYKVYSAHPAYQFIWHVGLSINAMTAAIMAVELKPIPTDGFLSLTCKAHDITVRLPAHSMVKDVRRQPVEDRPWIEVSFVSPREAEKNSEWAVGIREWMWLVVAAGFMQCIEEHRRRAHRHNAEVAKMAEVIRDACAHGLKIATKKSGGANLANLSITREDDGKPLSDFVGPGDFFVFALRMFSEPMPYRAFNIGK